MTGVAMTAAALVAGSLGWAFIVQPELRAEARTRSADDGSVRGDVRPSEVVTGQPGSYAQLDRLPEPRRMGARQEAASPAPAAISAA
ncbi:MAG TPA: hypothetical protein PKA17_04720, partial [Phenylobacterium sp.]|nr:hypothetical protein [Phenylobacterium sp.]